MSRQNGENGKKNPTLMRRILCILVASSLNLNDEAEDCTYCESAKLPPDNVLCCKPYVKACKKCLYAKEESPCTECCSTEHLDPLSEKKSNNNCYNCCNECYDPVVSEGSNCLGKNVAHAKGVNAVACNCNVGEEVDRLAKKSSNYTNYEADDPISDLNELSNNGSKKYCAEGIAYNEACKELLKTEKLLTCKYLNERKRDKDSGKNPCKGKQALDEIETHRPVSLDRTALSSYAGEQILEPRADLLKAEAGGYLLKESLNIH